MTDLYDVFNMLAAKLDIIADKLDRIALPTPQNDKTFGEFALYYFDSDSSRMLISISIGRCVSSQISSLLCPCCSLRKINERRGG